VKVDLPPLLEFLVRILSVITCISLVTMIIVIGSASDSPSADTGQVHAITDHGRTLFITHQMAVARWYAGLGLVISVLSGITIMFGTVIVREVIKGARSEGP
jgi:hypothetical protein